MYPSSQESYTSTMKLRLFSYLHPIVIFALLTVFTPKKEVNSQQRQFRDDRGKVFNIEGSPKIAVRAGIGGLSLYHFGMSADQVVAVWGLWGIRGSDLDLTNPQEPSSTITYPDADPTPEEIAFLQQAINLSPGCYNNPRGCFRWDNTSQVLALRDEIDYIVSIDNGFDENILETEEAGMEVIFIDTWFEYNENCRQFNYTVMDSDSCEGRSMIDIAQRIEELAIALGVDVDTQAVNADKKAACQAAEEFTNTMETVHAKGIRVKAAIFYSSNDVEGNTVVGFREFDPIQLWALRTLEELGMPLLHSGQESVVSSSEYFIDCASGNIDETCNNNTAHPVDFWLIDSRGYVLVKEPTFTSLFPDKAMIAGQHWYYVRNDGPVSFNSITRMLRSMAQKLAATKRMYPPTSCTVADPKSLSIIKQGGGLMENQYICYNAALIQSDYLQCPADDESSNTPVASPVGALAESSVKSASLCLASLACLSPMTFLFL